MAETQPDSSSAAEEAKIREASARFNNAMMGLVMVANVPVAIATAVEGAHKSLESALYPSGTALALAAASIYFFRRAALVGNVEDSID